MLLHASEAFPTTRLLNVNSYFILVILFFAFLIHTKMSGVALSTLMTCISIYSGNTCYSVSSVCSEILIHRSDLLFRNIVYPSVRILMNDFLL